MQDHGIRCGTRKMHVAPGYQMFYQEAGCSSIRSWMGIWQEGWMQQHQKLDGSSGKAARCSSIRSWMGHQDSRTEGSMQQYQQVRCSIRTEYWMNQHQPSGKEAGCSSIRKLDGPSDQEAECSSIRSWIGYQDSRIGDWMQQYQEVGWAIWTDGWMQQHQMLDGPSGKGAGCGSMNESSGVVAGSMARIMVHQYAGKKD